MIANMIDASLDDAREIPAEWQKVPEADRFGMNEDRLGAVLDASRRPDAG